MLRLVNDDGDARTSATVRRVDLVAATAAAAGVALLSLRAATGRVDLAPLTDVTPSVEPVYGCTTLSEENTVLTTDLSVKNAGNYAVAGKLVVAVVNLSDAAVGVMNPNRSRFPYDLRVLAGLIHAPRLAPLPAATADVGRTFAATALGADVDAQAIIYRLVAAPDGTVIDGVSGRISVASAASDIGTFDTWWRPRKSRRCRWYYYSQSRHDEDDRSRRGRRQGPAPESRLLEGINLTPDPRAVKDRFLADILTLAFCQLRRRGRIDSLRVADARDRPNQRPLTSNSSYKLVVVRWSWLERSKGCG